MLSKNINYKKFLIFFLTCSIISLSACEKVTSETESIRIDNNVSIVEETDANKIIKTLGVANDAFLCTGEQANHIVDFISEFPRGSHLGAAVITDDGSLYKISFNALFSNETNFKKIESNYKFVKFLGDSFLIDEKNNLYQYRGNDEIVSVEKTDDFGNSTYPYNEIGTYADNISRVFQLVGNGEYDFYYYDNNNIYSCETNKVVFSFPIEEIIEFSTENTIKTNKGWYYVNSICTNQNEVDKYVDIEPIYAVSCNYMNFKTNIQFYKSSLGEKYGTVFANGYVYGQLSDFDY